MPPYEITLINVDKDSSFTASQYAVEALIDSFKVSADCFEPQLRSHRTSSRSLITELILQPTHLLHIMSHGDFSGIISKERRFRSKRFDIADLRDFAETYRTFPNIDCVLMDACETYSRTWFKEVSGLLLRGLSVVYIGTTKTVDWRECTTFTSAFYLAFLQTPAPRTRAARQDAFISAFKTASKFWITTSGEPCPFKMKVIRSSR